MYVGMGMYKSSFRERKAERERERKDRQGEREGGRERERERKRCNQYRIVSENGILVFSLNHTPAHRCALRVLRGARLSRFRASLA